MKKTIYSSYYSYESKNTHGLSRTEAFAAFETGLGWLETQDEFQHNIQQIMVLLLKHLRNLATQKRAAAFYLTKKQ
jgi:hypothetical protein